MVERIGDFELERLIATGGMAEVFLARRIGAGPDAAPVVVKRMLPELAVNPAFVQMFVDEASLAMQLRHPNIVEVFHLGQEEKRFFLAMELVDGPHVGRLFAHSIRLRRPLPVEVCAHIVARAAEGLHAAHEHIDSATGRPLNIVHRDISPHNVLVSRAGAVKVVDFGIAKASTQQSKTRTGVIKGKVAYMSPEQCLGEKVDRRTDIFGLGVVLYELLTRRRLFRERSDLLVMQRITTEDVPPPSSLNPELDGRIDDICAQALARDRRARLASAAELSVQLDAWIAARRIQPPQVFLQHWFAAHAADLSIGDGPAHEDDSHSGVAEDKTDATASAPSMDSLLETVVSHPTNAAALGDAQRQVRSRDMMALSPHRPDAVLEGDGPTMALRPGQIARKGVEPAPARRHALTDGPSAGHDVQVSAKGARTRTAVAAGIVLFVVALSALTLRSMEPRPQGREAGAAGGPNPTAAAAGATGSIDITSVPSGVTILVDDSTVAGQTPLTLTRPAGRVKVQAQWPDQAPQSATVEVHAGQIHPLALHARVPLEVQSVPSRAEVRVDGELLGETPLRKAAVALPGASVEVKVELAGHVPLVRTLVPEPGQPLVVQAELERIRTEPRPRSASPAAFGFLNMRSTPWVEARVKATGENLGDTPLAQARVPAGKQVLLVQNPEVGIRQSVTITVPENRTLTLLLEWEAVDGKWRIKSKVVR